MLSDTQALKEKKNAPTVFDYMQLENGVTQKGGPKGQTKSGGQIQIKNRMRIKDFHQASKIRKKQEELKQVKNKKSLEGVDKVLQDKQCIEIKKQKYKKTVETWKEEIEKGLIKKGVKFDPELLIKLVMTDEDLNQDALDDLKIKPGTEMYDNWEKMKEQKNFFKKIKTKFDKVMLNPDKHFDRIIGYNTKQFGMKIKPERKVELFNEFEKALNGFNEKIQEKQELDWGERDLDNQQKDDDGAAIKPMKPEKFESNVRLRKVVGTQNYFSQVNNMNSKLLRNSSEVNIKDRQTSANAGGLNKSKIIDTMKTSKSQLLKSNQVGAKDFRVNRIETVKPTAKNLISKTEHDAIIKHKEKQLTNKRSTSSKSISRVKTSSQNLNSKHSLQKVKN